MKLSYVPALHKDRSFFILAHHTAYRDTVTSMFGWNEPEQDAFATKAFGQGSINIIWFENQRVGVVGWEHYPGHIWLKELYILPSKQRKGFGSMVISHVKHIAAERNIAIKLQTLKANTRAKALYERNGFVVAAQTDLHWEMVCP